MLFSGAQSSFEHNFGKVSGKSNLQVDQLQKEKINNLNDQIDSLNKERDETLANYQKNETIWEKKLEKMGQDNESLVELVGTLKDDNKDILIETDKYIKRVKQVENELGREKEAHLETQTEIRDLKRDL